MIKSSSIAPRKDTKTLSRGLASLKSAASDDAPGTFTGYLSVFGNVDEGGDVVDKGAFTQTLSDAKAKGGQVLWPILWQHNPDEPIGGIIDAGEDGYGLWIKGLLDLDIPLGQQAYSGIKQGYTCSLSIGYDVEKAYYQGSVRHLSVIRLWEGSIVTFPANPAALITDVKGQTWTRAPAPQWKAIEARVTQLELLVELRKLQVVLAEVKARQEAR